MRALKLFFIASILFLSSCTSLNYAPGKAYMEESQGAAT